MKLILSVILLTALTALTACATRQVNNRQQTFTEYVVLNKYSEYQGQSKEDWDNQPEDNFPGVRLIKWVKADKNK